MSESGRVARHVAIRGRVQGVGYRVWVEHAALQRGLDGFVRNRRDGSVEAVFAGPEEVVAAMLAACREGPPAAAVAGVEAREATAEECALRRRGELFSVLPTA